MYLIKDAKIRKKTENNINKFVNAKLFAPNFIKNNVIIAPKNKKSVIFMLYKTCISAKFCFVVKNNYVCSVF